MKPDVRAKLSKNFGKPMITIRFWPEDASEKPGVTSSYTFQVDHLEVAQQIVDRINLGREQELKE